MAGQAAVVTGTGTARAGIGVTARCMDAGTVFVAQLPWPRESQAVNFGGAATFDLTLDWSVSAQTTYEVQLHSLETGALIASASGGATTSHTFTLPDSLIGSMMRWRYKIDGGTWSRSYVFRLTNVPSFSIASPSAGALSGTVPTITFAFDAARTRYVPLTQHVRIVDTATGDVTHDSGVLPWTGEHVPPSGALDAGKEYRIEAEWRDSSGTDHTAERVVTTPAGPAAVHVEPPDTSTYEDDHTVRFQYWVDAVDPAWAANYIYRRRVGTDDEWKLLERSTVPFPGAGIGNALTYADEPWANIEWEYGVRQAINA